MTTESLLKQNRFFIKKKVWHIRINAILLCIKLNNLIQIILDIKNKVNFDSFVEPLDSSLVAN